ncbi:MAG: ferritin-like domain-containing protein [Alphaproteobacteria bacterium]|nr:ferritin-like domain-containing protein [Alphaproteobacteria bacterium]
MVAGPSARPVRSVRPQVHWTLDDIPWDRFDPSKVDPELVRAMRGACMVEHHSEDYVTYLCSVFSDDPEFQAAARAWGVEEVQHGAALRRWCELADPTWDFADCFGRFTAGHVLPLDAAVSVRGSRAKELIARCVVEVATSSFYSAIRDAVEEPLLKHICHRIAGDEYRHYKLFYDHMKRYRAVERPSAWQGIGIVLGRLLESRDDELAYAYYCGNAITEPYDRRRHGASYAKRTLTYYRHQHVAKAVAMTLKAAGVKPQSRWGQWASWLGWTVFRANTRKLHRFAA